MPWINHTGYSPGSRHYVESVIRTEGRAETRHGYTFNHFSDTATGMLCKSFQDPWMVTGYRTFNKATGKKGYTSGGFSVKEKVNLLQRNLCGRCVNQYVKDRPELGVALEAAKVGISS